MPSRDLQHSIAVADSINSTAVSNGNAATTGVAVDTAGYESVTLVLDVSAWTDGNYTLSVTNSATVGGTYTALAASQYIGQALPGSVNAIGVTIVGLLDCLEFVKAVVTQAGGTVGATFNAKVILGHPHHRLDPL